MDLPSSSVPSQLACKCGCPPDPFSATIQTALFQKNISTQHYWAEMFAFIYTQQPNRKNTSTRVGNRLYSFEQIPLPDSHFTIYRCFFWLFRFCSTTQLLTYSNLHSDYRPGKGRVRNMQQFQTRIVHNHSLYIAQERLQRQRFCDPKALVFVFFPIPVGSFRKKLHCAAGFTTRTGLFLLWLMMTTTSYNVLSHPPHYLEWTTNRTTHRSLQLFLA